MSYLISVIIPVYNAERFLPICLESIIEAKIEGLEIILVDDGSTDKSSEVCRMYREKYPFVHYLFQENSGPSVARNLGLKNAKGIYISFFDADDYVDSKAFARHVELLRQSRADIWVSDFHRVADNGCILDRVYQIKNTESPIIDSAYLSEFLAAKDCVWNVWRYIFRREFLEQENLRFAEGFHCAEDLEFVVRAFGATQSFAFLHEPYYFYRVNYGTTLTRSYTFGRVSQLMEMLKRAFNGLSDGDVSRLLKAKLSREYILNLSLLYEVACSERAAVKRELHSAKQLMSGATGIYAMAAKIVEIIGLPLAARILYGMKRVKRLLRTIKTRNV